MNKVTYDVLKKLYRNPDVTQREIANDLKYSLGIVNKSMKRLKDLGYLSDDYKLTEKTNESFEENKPKNAIILAAGMGLRMAPVNQDLPKALLYVKEKTLIENIIEKLHEKGINEIYIVVGYMKEKFDYLMDLYNVRLIVNNMYSTTNNLYSLYLARRYIRNSYIIPCDLYVELNPFHRNEFNSTYMVDTVKIETNYKKNKDGIMKLSSRKSMAYMPVGLSYINHEDSNKVKDLLEHINRNEFYNDEIFWESYLINHKINFYYEKVNGYIKEINTLDDLKEVDIDSKSLKTEIIDIISKSLNASIKDISNIEVSKKGMTNRSFLFEVKDQKYIMRIPGEGTDQLINRKEEGEVYKVIRPYHLSDDLIYFNKENGYKLTKYIRNSRVCDSLNVNDLKMTMKVLKDFHYKELKVDHYFDIFEKIEFYETLRNGRKSLYDDYEKTKQKVYELKKIIDESPKHMSLTHIDAVPDNFLIYEEDNETKIRLIDWEYASMQDTDVDLAMFSIYAMYDRQHVDQLIDIYYENNCPKNIRIKIYCYIAACGFLWSNWCEYKAMLGVEFGDYSIAQYRYAKDYYKIVMQELNEG